MPSQTTSTGSEIYRFVVRPKPGRDARAAGLAADAQALGLEDVCGLECQDLYFIEGRLSGSALGHIASELLSDPITQIVQYGRITPASEGEEVDGASPADVIEVALRPGVTDPVAEQIVRAARQLGIEGVQRASTGQRYVVSGEGMDSHTLHLLAQRLLANPVIQRYAIGEIDPVFPHPAESSGQVDSLPLRQRTDDKLLALSQERRAALDLAEMRAIQAFYRREGREPSDIEFEMIAQTWSEHCVHKTFKARIEVSQAEADSAEQPQVVDGLLKTYLRAATEKIAAPWVRSAFVDNAGILEFDGVNEVSFKVETHNHPSAIEPFGGANTGVGGVIRDVLGVSARPIAATDILCFGPQDLPLEALPESVLHPRRIQSGVVAGVQDYGNKIGIPTVNGAILYDPGYTANPLVFCGCVGIAPRGSHPRQPHPGDRVIVLGGRTGRDGLRGATFSSMTMDAQTGEVAGASVQIGDPITEKGLIEVILRARDRKLYSGITDCGAGGLSSAVGEMSSECGAQVELKDVRLKYPGLAPWEIWLSEAQERMVLAVPEANLLALKEICNLFEVELTDIGAFNDSGRLVVQVGGKTVLDLENDFLHKGIPQRSLRAVVNPPEWGGRTTEVVTTRELRVGGEEEESGRKGGTTEGRTTEVVTTRIPEDVKGYAGGTTEGGASSEVTTNVLSEEGDANRILLSLLAHPDIRSKAGVIRIYDHEIQGGTVVKPLVGVHSDAPSDAVVLHPQGTVGNGGLVLSNGINPAYGKVDPYRMAWSVIDEAIRNAVAVGANPDQVALLDNFCWGDPTHPETLGALVEAARGCHDAALYYGAPFISGKDSLNNEYFGTDGLRHAIPPTLLISAIGVIGDVSRTVTMDLKTPGSLIYLLGSIPIDLDGDPLFRLRSLTPPEPATAAASYEVPAVPEVTRDLYRAFHQAAQSGLVQACHDLSEGGLAVAAAEMCIGGRLGMDLQLDETDSFIFFREANAALLVEVRPQDKAAFETCFEALAGSPMQRIGQVTAARILRMVHQGASRVELPVRALVEAWGAQ